MTFFCTFTHFLLDSSEDDFPLFGDGFPLFAKDIFCFVSSVCFFPENGFGLVLKYSFINLDDFSLVCSETI